MKHDFDQRIHKMQQLRAVLYIFEIEIKFIYCFGEEKSKTASGNFNYACY